MPLPVPATNQGKGKQVSPEVGLFSRERRLGGGEVDPNFEAWASCPDPPGHRKKAPATLVRKGFAAMLPGALWPCD